MIFDLFLWPMLIPLAIPLVYCIYYQKKEVFDVLVIIFIMVLIVFFYIPLSYSFYSDANFYVKMLLFVLLPVFVLFIWSRIRKRIFEEEDIFRWEYFGINTKGLEKSLKLGIVFLPIMLFTSFIVIYINGQVIPGSYILGDVYFVESITEEFFFRGLLFLFLWRFTSLKVAYVTSVSSFVLMHPNNLADVFILSTIVQGFLTVEVCRRSKNLLGAWIVHGANRFFIIVIIALIL